MELEGPRIVTTVLTKTKAGQSPAPHSQIVPRRYSDQNSMILAQTCEYEYACACMHECACAWELGGRECVHVGTQVCV